MEDIKKDSWITLDYAGWLNQFKENDKIRLYIDENLPGTLSEEEKKLISASIASFQRGEYSEGRTLRKFAEVFFHKI